MRISDWSSDVCSSDLPEFYVLMSGHGYVFSPEANHRPLLRTIVRRLYRTGVRRAKVIFVFNSDDRHEMIRQRSEERRVGKECVSPFRSRWSQYHQTNKPPKSRIDRNNNEQ